MKNFALIIVSCFCFVTTAFASTGLDKFYAKAIVNLDDSKLSKSEVDKESFDMMCTYYQVRTDCDGDGSWDYDYTGCFESYAHAVAMAKQQRSSCNQQ